MKQINNKKIKLEKILEKAKKIEYEVIDLTLPPDIFKWLYYKSKNHRKKMVLHEYIIHLINVRKGYYDSASKRNK